MKNIDRSEKYNVINKIFNNYLLEIEGSFFYDHIRHFIFLAQEIRKIIVEHDQMFQGNPKVYKLLNPGCDELTEYLSWPETLQIVRDYFQQRLPQYAKIFEDCLNNGIINIAIDLDDPTQDKRSHAGYQGNHHFVNTRIEHNYFDPKKIVHEFMHYLNSPGSKTSFPFTRCLLTETISIFFECDILKFMQEKGYSQKEIAKVFHSRIEESYNLAYSLLLELSLINTFKYTGNLSDQSLKEGKALHLFSGPTQEDYLADIDCLYESFINASSPLEPPNISAGYLLGATIVFSYLAQEDSDAINKFIALNESVNSKSEIDCLKIIGIDVNKKDILRDVLGNFQKTVEKVSKTSLNEDFYSKKI